METLVDQLVKLVKKLLKTDMSKRTYAGDHHNCTFSQKRYVLVNGGNRTSAENPKKGSSGVNKKLEKQEACG